MTFDLLAMEDCNGDVQGIWGFSFPRFSLSISLRASVGQPVLLSASARALGLPRPPLAFHGASFPRPFLPETARRCGLEPRSMPWLFYCLFVSPAVLRYFLLGLGTFMSTGSSELSW